MYILSYTSCSNELKSCSRLALISPLTVCFCTCLLTLKSRANRLRLNYIAVIFWLWRETPGHRMLTFCYGVWCLSLVFEFVWVGLRKKWLSFCLENSSKLTCTHVSRELLWMCVYVNERGTESGSCIMLRVAVVTGCHAPQEAGPSETKITGRLKQSAWSLLESCLFWCCHCFNLAVAVAFLDSAFYGV